MLKSGPRPVAPNDAAGRIPARGDESIDESRLAHLLGYQLARADIPARQAFARHIGEPMGLRPVEFTFLVLVSANPGVTAKRLAQALAVAAPNITLLLDRLSERGWVERMRSQADRRAQHIHLTPAGQKVAQRALAVSRTMEQELVRHLTEGEHAMLLELLQKVARQTR